MGFTKKRVVLITGINNPQGIGAATTFAFAREGASLVLVYKRLAHSYNEDMADQNGFDRYYKANGSGAEEVEERLRSLNADYHIYESDISDESCVLDIYDRAIKRFGRVDILINNAAGCAEDGTDTIELLTADTIDNTFAVNVKGTLLMTREFIKRRGTFGRVINLSTDSAQVFPGQITYGASKAAIEAFTRSIALEAGKYGITVNCIAPGPTQTGYIDDAAEKALLPDIPLGTLITPHDIAEAIMFLSSERAAMITGQVIKVSGGHAL